jgi:LytS/YehU family sensor histidine kinase
MILQPIAENSIKHAIATQEKGGKITITVNHFANDLLIELVDDGPGTAIIDGDLYRENGVGLINTRERLHALYDNNYSLVVANNTPSGVKVSIRMPFELSSCVNKKNALNALPGLSYDFPHYYR